MTASLNFGTRPQSGVGIHSRRPSGSKPKPTKEPRLRSSVRRGKISSRLQESHTLEPTRALVLRGAQAWAVRQWVVVFPKRVRYFLDRDADCLKRVAVIAMREVQRATAGASTSTAAVGRSGGVLFVHRFGATLNAHVHLHLCMLDGVVAQGRQGLVRRDSMNACSGPWIILPCGRLNRSASRPSRGIAVCPHRASATCFASRRVKLRRCMRKSCVCACLVVQWISAPACSTGCARCQK